MGIVPTEDPSAAGGDAKTPRDIPANKITKEEEESWLAMAGNDLTDVADGACFNSRNECSILAKMHLYGQGCMFWEVMNYSKCETCCTQLSRHTRLQPLFLAKYRELC